MTGQGVFRFDGTHESVVRLMRFVEVGTTTTTIKIHASSDPTETRIVIPTPAGRVTIRAGATLTRGPGGTFLVNDRPA